MHRGALLVAVALCLFVVACAGASTAHSREPVPSLTSMSFIITLDPPMNTETFAPPGNAKSDLTAEEALAAFQKVDAEFELPVDATSQLGFYTASVGDGTYRFQDRLAWGFTWQQCAQPQHDVSPDTVLPCTKWLFLDANTGEMLELVWQRSS
jgi:hypothetical protein